VLDGGSGALVGPPDRLVHRLTGDLAVKIGGHRSFHLVVGRTGPKDAEAREAGFEPMTVAVTADDHKA